MKLHIQSISLMCITHPHGTTVSWRLLYMEANSCHVRGFKMSSSLTVDQVAMVSCRTESLNKFFKAELPCRWQCRECYKHLINPVSIILKLAVDISQNLFSFFFSYLQWTYGTWFQMWLIQFVTKALPAFSTLEFSQAEYFFHFTQGTSTGVCNGKTEREILSLFWLSRQHFLGGSNAPEVGSKVG